VPSPYNAPDLFNWITLGRTDSPGVLKGISGHDSEEDWDVKVVPGQKGAQMTRKSKKPIEFDCTFYLNDDSYTPGGIDDFAEWDQFCTLVESTISGPKPIALPIYHPDLARVGVKSVVKKKIGGLSHDGKGGATGVIRFIEYFPPKPVGGSPTKKLVPDPNAALKKELEGLVNEYQKTPWG
jgi:hypothetical protein